jgi:hypothetical protein
MRDILGVLDDAVPRLLAIEVLRSNDPWVAHIECHPEDMGRMVEWLAQCGYLVAPGSGYIAVIHPRAKRSDGRLNG